MNGSILSMERNRGYGRLRFSEIWSSRFAQSPYKCFQKGATISGSLMGVFNNFSGATPSDHCTPRVLDMLLLADLLITLSTQKASHEVIISNSVV